MPDNDTTVSVLNDLIQVCKDGHNGYQTATRCVTNTDLKALFKSYARQRTQYAAELQSEVRRLGGQPVNRGSLAGPAGRAWTNIRSLLCGDSEHAVFAVCERGEDSARDAYQDAVKSHDLPAHVQALLERQLAGIKEAHERVRALETATAHS
jgi:uncharacterized protein (TIGR02284 family)